LAAKCFGAGPVTGIDNDPAAISVAESNARLNKIRGTSFQLGDFRKQKHAQNTDVITANLYNDLIIKILPKLKASRWLILSGVLGNQQHELGRALRQNQYDIVETRRRGKWVAILARRTDAVRPLELKSPNFCGSHRPPLQ
jgi:ribosomal protein L11 methylase PrmA